MDIDDVLEINLLFDFYGELLTPRQREVVDLYHEENLSLAEIAAEFNISRQGVYDALKAGEKALRGYEEKLGLVRRFNDTRKQIYAVDGMIEDIMRSRADDRELSEALEKIRISIDDME